MWVNNAKPRTDNYRRGSLKDLIHDAEARAARRPNQRGYRNVAGEVKPGIGNRWGVEDSASGSDHRFAMRPAWGPGKPQSRTPVRTIRKDQRIGKAVVPHDRQVSGRVRVGVELDITRQPFEG